MDDDAAADSYHLVEFLSFVCLKTKSSRFLTCRDDSGPAWEPTAQRADRQNGVEWSDPPPYYGMMMVVRAPVSVDED